MNADRFALDPIRNTFRCLHCRAEIHVDRSLIEMMNAQSDFVEAHLHCAPAATPAPVDVPLASGLLRRDHLGLWSSWHPIPALGGWRVEALTLEDAVTQLRVAQHTLQQRVTLLGSTLPREVAQLDTLAQVLGSEGQAAAPAVAVAG